MKYISLEISRFSSTKNVHPVPMASEKFSIHSFTPSLAGVYGHIISPGLLLAATLLPFDDTKTPHLKSSTGRNSLEKLARSVEEGRDALRTGRRTGRVAEDVNASRRERVD